ncbi:MAG: recombinase RecT [Planctomycetota bacterium]|nr:recombinase RecT [Planctomycetota bacterium]
MSTTTEIASAKESPLQTVMGMLDKNKAQIEAALPSLMNGDRFMQIALTSLRLNAELLKCAPMSIVKCVLQSSQLGLDLDGVLGHAYMVPYGRRGKQQKEAQLIVGYKGWVQLCRRSGEISTIEAHVVHSCDKFEHHMGDDPKIVHVPAYGIDNRRECPITFVYAISILKDGGKQREVWDFNHIEDHKKKYAQGLDKTTSPWRTNWDWMAKKTVLRQLCKLLPMSVEPQRQLASEERREHDAAFAEPATTIVSGLDELTDSLGAANEKQSLESPEVDLPKAKEAADEIVEDAPEDRERRSNTSEDAQQELIDRRGPNAQAV